MSVFSVTAIDRQRGCCRGLHRKSEYVCGLAIFSVATLVGTSLLGQERPTPLIKIIATGGTIANTVEGRISIQQTIADIRKMFSEGRQVLDSVRIEVVDVIRMGSSRFTSKEFLDIARSVNDARDIVKCCV